MAPGRVQHQNDLVCGSMILEVAAELFHGFLHNCMIVPGGIFAPKTEAFWDVWSNFIKKLDRELALVSNEDLGELWLNSWVVCEEGKKGNIGPGIFLFDSFLFVCSLWR